MDGAELQAAFGSGGSISTHRTQVARREILLLWEESPDGALTHGRSRSLTANAVEEGWLASWSSPWSKPLGAAELIPKIRKSSLKWPQWHWIKLRSCFIWLAACTESTDELIIRDNIFHRGLEAHIAICWVSLDSNCNKASLVIACSYFLSPKTVSVHQVFSWYWAAQLYRGYCRNI